MVILNLSFSLLAQLVPPDMCAHCWQSTLYNMDVLNQASVLALALRQLTLPQYFTTAIPVCHQEIQVIAVCQCM